FYVLQLDRTEPFEESEIISLWKKGTLTDTDLVRTEESEEWTPLVQLLYKSVSSIDDKFKLRHADKTPYTTEMISEALAQVNKAIASIGVGKISVGVSCVLLLTFLVSWSYALSATLLCLFVLVAFGICCFVGSPLVGAV